MAALGAGDEARSVGVASEPVFGRTQSLDTRSHRYTVAGIGEPCMSFSAETKLGVLLDNPTTKEVLVKYLPEIQTAGPMLAMARGLTLKALANVARSKIPPEKLQAIVDELEQL
jgi:hypothetical protein